MLSPNPVICSICGIEFHGYGNNAQPINEGRCCARCDNLVSRRRLQDMAREQSAQPKWRRGFNTPEHYPEEE